MPIIHGNDVVAYSKKLTTDENSQIYVAYETAVRRHLHCSPVIPGYPYQPIIGSEEDRRDQNTELGIVLDYILKTRT